MRLLIIAYAFPPISAVGAMRPLRWCKYLTAHTDWEPTVIAVDRPSLRRDETLAREIPDGVTVHRVPSWEPLRWLERRSAGRTRRAGSAEDATPPPDTAPPPEAAGPPRLTPRRFVRDLLATPDEQGLWSLPVVAKALRLHRERPFDAVLVTSPPWSIQFAGRMLAGLLRIPWIADYRDPWNDVERGHRTDAFESWNRRLEEAVIPRAAAVISTSDTYSDVLRARFPGRPAGTFVTLYNGFDETKFAAAPAAARRRFTMVHLGTLYEIWDPWDLFAGIAGWLDARPGLRDRVVLRFVGRLGTRAEARLADLGLQDVVEITGFVDHLEAVARCREADVLLLALGAGEGVPRGWLPSKLFEYVACERPILANVNEGEARNLITSAAAGFAVGRNDTAAYATVLDDLLARKEAGGGRVAWRNRPEVVDRLTQRRLGAELAALLDRVARRAEPD